MNTGTLAITNSTISGNSATIFGGGIGNLGGSVTITNSTVSGNTATKQQAGGLLNGTGPVTITGSTISGNSAPNAGGIENGGTMTITDSTLSQNTASPNGGGAIQNDGTLTVTGSTLANNSAAGGAGIYNFGAATISGSTFTGNTSTSSGGAITNTNISKSLSITNSTFFANSATGSGGAIVDVGSATITSGTFAGNSSPDGGALYFSSLNGGTLTLGDTILASSSGSDNCSFSGTFTDAGYNLDDGTSCGFTNANHDLSSTNPTLGALASNGGPTQTMALLPGSPAIDAGGTSANGCPATDQRNITRPQGAACDIGAYEFVPTTTTTLVATPTTAVSGQNVQLCATVKAGANNTGTPIGTVTFKEGSSSLGTATLSGGKACFNTTTLALGTHSITAVYAGGGGFSGNTSAPVSVVIGVPGQDVSGGAPGNPQSAPGAEGSDNPAVPSGQANGTSQAPSGAHAQQGGNVGHPTSHPGPATPGLPLWLPLGGALLLLGLGGLGVVLYRARQVAAARS